MMISPLARRSKALSATLSAVALCSTALVSVPALAQTTAAHPAPKNLNIVQKHPTMTGLAAGVATHSALKHSAAWKKAHHQKLNFAERHPTLTGIAAGVTTRHVIKKTTPKVHS